MYQEIKEKWCTALESGDYVQGKNQLRNVSEKVESFCCLGVLTDIFIKETGEGEWDTDGFKLSSRSIVFKNDCLPYVVMVWAGLNADNPLVDNPLKSIASVISLAALNDHGFPFKEISKVIKTSIFL
jgi:hypothetical protein